MTSTSAPINWTAFLRSPGDPRRNWESLCRAVIERNYARFGRLRSVRQQPGVEFYLCLDTDSNLGPAGTMWGWQCRWYELPQTKRLGADRRDEIVKAIRTTERHLPDITDWVLWLRELPRKADIDWFYAIDTPFRLHIWSEPELETRLLGESAVLREAYFGELVLTDEQLQLARERSLAPIERRWDPIVHVEVSVERTLRQALAEPGAWLRLRNQSRRLRERARELETIPEANKEEQRTATGIGKDLQALADTLEAVYQLTDRGQPDEAARRCASDPPLRVSGSALRRLSTALRSQRNPAALSLAAAEADRHDGLALLHHARELLGSSLFAVVGDAGQGKSYLAAELTGASDQRPAGVLMLGSDLGAFDTLDELARRLQGIPVERFDDLLEAVNAAGMRAGRRLPVVIDGLNEAENPLRWKTLLGGLAPLLPRFPFVVIVVTLRSSVADDALVPQARRLTLDGFAHDLVEAVERYFAYYRINPGTARLPWKRFEQPLFLRIYCEATNPDRKRVVGAEALPTSLTAAFERYRDSATERVRERLRRPPGSVASSLARFGLELWKRDARFLPSNELAAIFGDDERDWDRSVVRALEEEGVLWRGPGETWADPRTGVLFDPFAGFLVADALLRSVPRHDLGILLDDAETWRKLDFDPEVGHPLADDILVSLVGVLPRHSKQQVWQVAPSKLRNWAIAQASTLEAEYLDPATVEAIAHLVQQLPAGRRYYRRHLFDRLSEVRGAPAHPLNADFTDRVLRAMSVADRDQRWTEWIRARATELGEDLSRSEELWKEREERDSSDRLEALWTGWLLTSTVRPLRDEATRALYWYGRGEAAALFSLTIDFVPVNDTYVFERCAAASYGVVMAHQKSRPASTFLRALAKYLRDLHAAFYAPNATHPTSHWLARQYIEGVFEFVEKLHPAAVRPDMGPRLPQAGPEPESIADEDPRAQECDQTLHMDFANYTVGRLIEGRANYQSDHRLYRAVLAEIRGRVWELGWRASAFQELDKDIASGSWTRDHRPGKTERYGKKYGWIAYYEAAGRLADSGQLRDPFDSSERLPDVDIDPSFPDPAPPLTVESASWVQSAPADNGQWLTSGEVKVSDALLQPQALEGRPGPWVAVDGFLKETDDALGREVFGFVRGILVNKSDVKRVVATLSTVPYLGNWLIPDCPSDYYVFAGEIPWSRVFAAETHYYEGLAPYETPLREEDGPVVELLAHDYAFESYHSVLNQAGGTSVPSKRFSTALGLRGVAQTFDQIDRSGNWGAMSRSGPRGFSGSLLYLRADLLREYTRGSNRSLVVVSWGERSVLTDWQNPPHWVREAAQSHADVWRDVRVIKL